MCNFGTLAIQERLRERIHAAFCYIYLTNVQDMDTCLQGHVHTVPLGKLRDDLCTHFGQCNVNQTDMDHFLMEVFNFQEWIHQPFAC